MSIVYALLPASSLVFSLPYRCVPEPKTWVPPEKVRAAVWAILAITTGLTGLDIYDLNDQEANTLFIALVFFFGTGWAITTRLCNQYANLIYVVLMIFLTLWLYNRLGIFKDTSKDAKSGRFWLVPLILWLFFTLFLASIALGAKLFEHRSSFDTITFSV
jgi:tryptophan-rich sensory protein